MINNLEKIKSFLTFETEDDFYHLQILKRKKEHPELGSNSYVVKTYYIQSIEYLEMKMPEIINLCDFHDARAYINLNKRSFEKAAFHTMMKICGQIMQKDYKSARKAFESVCGSLGHGGEGKLWVIDVDTKDNIQLQQIINDICNCIPERRSHKIKLILETRNGWHLITSPFNVSEFSELHPDIEIHKNNPTILYIK